MKNIFVSFSMAAALGLVSTAAFAVVQAPDLAVQSVVTKNKCDSTETTCVIQNLTIYVANNGSADAGKSTMELWLSDDTTLSTDTDTLIKRVAVPKIKQNFNCKRNFGGGLFKKLNLHGTQYFIAVVDSNHVVQESNESNNTIAASHH